MSTDMDTTTDTTTDTNTNTIPKKSHVPSIVTIKAQEKEIELLLAQYKLANDAYINSLNQGLTNNASVYLDIMSGLNDAIKVLLLTVRIEIYNIYPKGIANQSAVTLNVTKLKELEAILAYNEKKLQIMMEEELALNGKYSSSTIDVQSYRYHYIFYIIVAVILSWLLFRVFSTNDPDDKLESLFLIMAIIIIFYQFVFKGLIKVFEFIIKFVKGVLHSLNV